MFQKLFKVSIVGLLLLAFTHGLEQMQTPNGAANRRTVQINSNALSFRETLEKYSQLASSTENCTDLLSKELIDEIGGYKEIAEEIIELIVNGEFKGKTFQELEDLVVRYPQRPSGHQSLEDSIDYMMDRMRDYGLANVRGEQVPVSHWIRGEEKAEMVEPHRKGIRMLGLGRTVGTPEGGITGEVIVVKSFADLDAKKDQVKGKIVVYNQGWQGSYGATKDYRASGASHASQYGAIAALIQSVAPFSLDTPHTGGQNYWSNVTHIPAACITMEDADYMYRLQEKGRPIKVHLKMLDYNLPMTTSRNVIGEIVGKTKPTEYVAVTGHIDSWDLGQGTMDDGGGIMISVMALAALKHLNRQPSRTLQAILWTSEEVGLEGVQGFVKQHRNQLLNYSAVFESDTGTFRPRGLDFAGSEKAGCIVNEVLKLTSQINTTDYARYDTVSSDITYLIAEGVPGLSLNTENDRYFWYHHTEADTLAMMDSEELDLDTALWAVTSYVLSDISEKLPRDTSTGSP